MDNQKFQVEFMSSQDNFIYNFGVNKGYNISYKKIDRCYFLSSQATQLYRNIAHYAYGDKVECFPSQVALSLELDWDTDTLKKYTDELKDKKLIETKKRPGKTMTYVLNELHKVPVIIHSEIVHEIRVEYFNGSEKIMEFKKKLKKYKKSNLFKEVEASENPLDYKDKIEEWFLAEGREEKFESIDFPKTFSINGINKESSTGKKKNKVRNPYQLPVEEWGTHQFVKYFEAEYKNKFNMVYITSGADMKMMKRLLENRGDEKEVLKQHLDNYLKLDFFNPKIIKTFCSNSVQSMLDFYLTNGELPSYNKNKSKTQIETSSERKKELDELFK